MFSTRGRTFALAAVTFATFVDIVAYSIAVPVLPDLSQRVGASPTTIGLLFASFGVTLLTVSIPMGSISDRIGRRGPLAGGLVLLAGATAVFGLTDWLPALFAARMLQGAADAMTWVVGFALIADLYESSERSRVTGIVMASSSFAYMLGPSIGGWLYQWGGARLPFLALAALSLAGAVLFAGIESSARHSETEPVPLAAILREPAVLACTCVVLAVGSTLSMYEPVFALHLQTRAGLGPARIGLVFAAAALANVGLHPLFGYVADKVGARRQAIVGMGVMAATLPFVARAWSFESAVALNTLEALAVAIVVTPSLTYMADAVSSVGLGTFGVAYGLYNMAWGAGMLMGPAAGGYLYERLGFERLALVWAPALALAMILVAAVQSRPIAPERT